MATRDYEETLTKRLLIVAGIYVALLCAVQLPTVIISVRYARLSTDLLYTGDLTVMRNVIMVLSPLSNYIRVAFLGWVTFYYGKKNSVTVLIITVGSLILSAGMEASPDRTSDIYFTYDWSTHLAEYAIRFASAIIVTFVLWFVAAELGRKYRKHSRHTKKLPMLSTYGVASGAFLAVDLLFQLYFFLSSSGKDQTALDWIYPFIKAGGGFLFACCVGYIMTVIRRRKRNNDKKIKDQSKKD